MRAAVGLYDDHRHPEFRRLGDGSGPQDLSEWRYPLSRDYDKVLYSSAWRRMRGVTQVAPLTDGIVRGHDRSLHSLKVAQIGLRLAEYICVDPDRKGYKSSGLREMPLPRAVEVAGMVHDLGHPPFGHVAEKELQACLEEYAPTPPWREAEGSDDFHSRAQKNPWHLSDSFEGNAQTFRILTRIASKSPAPAKGGATRSKRGLDLTVATLAASVKYPWRRLQAKEVLTARGDWNEEHAEYYEKKWGVYNDDALTWHEVVQLRKAPGDTYSVNADLMDMADDVTYAVHDVHDYFRTGLIPLHEIGMGLSGHGNATYQKFRTAATTSLATKPEVDYEDGIFDEALDWLRARTFPRDVYTDSEADRGLLHQFESEIVREAQSSVVVVDGRPRFEPKVQMAIEFLKELTWYYVINDPRLAASQQGQRLIVRNLHAWLCEWAFECYNKNSAKASRNRRRLPPRFSALLGINAKRGALSRSSVSRASVDYIAGLTDAEAVSLHHHLGGTGSVVAPVAWM